MSPRISVAAVTGEWRRAENAATKKATPTSASTPLFNRSMASTWKSECVDFAAQAEFDLLGLQVAERAGDRLLHRSLDAAGRL